MKHLLIALSLATLAGLASARPARAAAPAASDATSAAAANANANANANVASVQPGTPQRSKMKVCNANAKVKALHGDERRAFMKQCLSGKVKPAVAS